MGQQKSKWFMLIQEEKECDMYHYKRRDHTLAKRDITFWEN